MDSDVRHIHIFYLQFFLKHWIWSGSHKELINVNSVANVYKAHFTAPEVDKEVTAIFLKGTDKGVENTEPLTITTRKL
jgi:hypothetical protein